MTVEAAEPAAVEGNEEFSSAFAEFSSARDGGDNDDKPELEEIEEVAAPIGEEEPDPEVETEKEPKPENDPEKEPDVVPDSQEDIKAKYEALVETNANLDQTIRSNHGRVGGLQKKINDLEAELAKPTAATGSAAEALADDDVSWEDFQKDYPDIAKAMDARFSQETTRTNETLNTQIQTAVKPFEAAAKRTNRDIVLEALTTPIDKGGYGHEDFEEVVKSPTFTTWLDAQPQSTKGLAVSEDVNDAAALVQSYKATRAALGADPTTVVKDDDNAAPGDVEKIEARRVKQLEKGTTDIPSSPAEIAKSGKGGGDEFSAAFKFFAKKKEKESRR